MVKFSLNSLNFFVRHGSWIFSCFFRVFLCFLKNKRKCKGKSHFCNSHKSQKILFKTHSFFSLNILLLQHDTCCLIINDIISKKTCMHLRIINSLLLAKMYIHWFCNISTMRKRCKLHHVSFLLTTSCIEHII